MTQQFKNVGSVHCDDIPLSSDLKKSFFLHNLASRFEL